MPKDESVAPSRPACTRSSTTTAWGPCTARVVRSTTQHRSVCLPLCSLASSPHGRRLLAHACGRVCEAAPRQTSPLPLPVRTGGAPAGSQGSPLAPPTRCRPRAGPRRPPRRTTAPTCDGNGDAPDPGPLRIANAPSALARFSLVPLPACAHSPKHRAVCLQRQVARHLHTHRQPRGTHAPSTRLTRQLAATARGLCVPTQSTSGVHSGDGKSAHHLPDVRVDRRRPVAARRVRAVARRPAAAGRGGPAAARAALAATCSAGGGALL